MRALDAAIQALMVVIPSDDYYEHAKQALSDLCAKAEALGKEFAAVDARKQAEEEAKRQAEAESRKRAEEDLEFLDFAPFVLFPLFLQKTSCKNATGVRKTTKNHNENQKYLPEWHRSVSRRAL